MELDQHITRLLSRADVAQERMERVRDYSIEHSWIGPLRPEMIRRETKAAVAIGGVAVELARLMPHVPELYKLYKQQESGK